MTIRAMLFDLDNTLYPAAAGVMQSIDRRINEYVQQYLGVSQQEAVEIRCHYYTTYGTTLRGLQQNYGPIATEEYLRFVHDVAIEDLLKLDAILDEALARIPVRKVIFTNSPAEHAERVLNVLGLTHHFERVFDLRYFNFVAKPDPSCYQHILDQLGIKGDEALLFEDTPHNLPPAKVLGMTTILIDDSAVACANADYQVPDLLSGLAIAEELITQSLTVLRTAVPAPRDKVRVRRGP